MLIERCECGKALRKGQRFCRPCGEARSRRRIAEAQAIVATGKCPDCGEGLRRNLSLSGWWQCSQLGAEGFRADVSRPSCSFQTFTE